MTSSSMISAELYKVRHHRMPYLLTAAGGLAVSAPSIYFLFNAPDGNGAYGEAALAVFAIFALLAGTVFGGWMLGHEYRQGTLQRVASVDARRGRLLAAKAAGGIVTFAAMLAAMSAIAFGAAGLAAAVNGDSLVVDDLMRTIGAAVLPASVAAGLAFVASAIFASDTYATLTSLSVMMLFAPLLALIPRVGNYSLASATSELADWIATSTTPTSGAMAMVATVVAWLAVAGLAGHRLFAGREI